MPMPSFPVAQIVTVSELTSSLKEMLESCFSFVSVVGEVSNLRQPFSGHLYFTLKDANAQLKAVLFKPQQRYLDRLPQDGQRLVCRGRLSLYEPRGEYQLIVDSLEFQGAGALQLAFEQLKQKLAGEGLFDPARKKKIPTLPERIVLITSPQGAAVHDFIALAQARFPGIKIEIYPVRVQGAGAAEEMATAIARLDRRGLNDVMVLCRGGGSLEDLWAFNEELLARAIFAAQTPIVSAVGHEIDFTIADFVADQRAPTPTAAAELLAPDRKALLAQVGHRHHRLCEAMQGQIDRYRQRTQTMRRIIGDPSRILDQARMRLDQLQSALLHRQHRYLHALNSQLEQLTSRLQQVTPRHRLHLAQLQLQSLARRVEAALAQQVAQKQNALQQQAALLDAVSPLAVLGRGYALVRRQRNREVIRASAQASPGELLQILLAQGELTCEVREKK